MYLKEMTGFELKDLMDNGLYKTFNTISRLFYCINYPKIKKIIRKNSELKNKHVGERCFIIGNGPSLNDTDISYIKDEFTFATNYFYKSKQYKILQPTYYLLLDGGFFQEKSEILNEIISEISASTLILNYKGKKKVENCEDSLKTIYYLYQRLFPHKKLQCVDASKNMTIGLNVVIGCIQMAIYMGFKEIYLIGTDFNSFSSTKSIHCYNSNEERTISIGDELKFYSLVSYFHYYLEEYTDKNNIKIYNASKYSLLDAYERINYEKIFLKNNERI